MSLVCARRKAETINQLISIHFLRLAAAAAASRAPRDLEAAAAYRRHCARCAAQKQAPADGCGKQKQEACFSSRNASWLPPSALLSQFQLCARKSRQKYTRLPITVSHQIANKLTLIATPNFALVNTRDGRKRLSTSYLAANNAPAAAAIVGLQSGPSCGLLQVARRCLRRREPSAPWPRRRRCLAALRTPRRAALTRFTFALEPLIGAWNLNDTTRVRRRRPSARGAVAAPRDKDAAAT